jgi:hypothetical protein
MKNLTGNEPATPCIVYFTPENEMVTDFAPGRVLAQMPGLTIRQEFAARAMQGLMSKQIPSDWNKKEVRLAWVEWVAEMSCEIADELISKLNELK